MYSLPPQVNTALTLLNQAGFEAFVVGGAVRDLLRGACVHDWDITTSALPEQTEGVFADYRLIETGRKHGTVTVMLDGFPLEITTYRTESSYSDHRRPDRVEFTSRLEEDLARRDFTVNAMAYHPTRGIVDLFGGRADLSARVIRCVGKPDQRFREDALRILRALRFAACLGFSIEESTAAAIHRNHALLSVLAVERIREELTGLLCGSHVKSVLHQYRNVLCVPIPELARDPGFPTHTVSVIAACPALPEYRWAGLLHALPAPSGAHTALARQVVERLRFDKVSREQILFLVEHQRLLHGADEERLRRAIQQFGMEKLRQLRPFLSALSPGEDPREPDALYTRLEELAARQDRLTPKELAISGRELLALNYRGAQIGHALEALVHAVVFEGVENTPEALLAYLAEHPQQSAAI